MHKVQPSMCVAAVRKLFIGVFANASTNCAFMRTHANSEWKGKLSPRELIYFTVLPLHDDWHVMIRI